MARQILKSGTSIGANLSEAKYAISRKDFLSKKYIALKECGETQFWLELLHETGFLAEEEFASLISDNDEILKILIAATKNLKTNSKE
jgi:four helix bundle protein